MKIYRLLLLLTDTETSLLKDFAKSSFYNKRKDTSMYIQKIIDSIKKTPDIKDFDDTLLYQKIYPNSTFSDNKWRKLRADATKLVEKFIGVLEQQKNNDNSYSLILFFREHEAFDLMDSVIEKQEGYLREIKNKTSVDYGKLADIYAIKDGTNLRRKKRDPKLVPQMLHNQVMSFAILQSKTLLSLYINLDTDNLLNNKKLTVKFLNWTEAFDYTENITLEIYLHLIRMLIIEKEGDDDVYYSKVKAIILNKNESINLIDDLELSAIVSTIRIFCVIKCNKNKEYAKEAFFWMQYILSNKKIYYIFKKIISPFTYLSFIHVSINAKEFDFTKKFIDEYSIYLPDDVREQYRCYATAIFYFYQKKYDEAEKELIDAESMPKNNDILKIYFYLLWTKICYEIENYDLLEVYINRFRVFCSRNENLPKHITLGINDFLLVVTKLLKVSYLKEVSTINPEMIEEITTLIARLQPLYEDDWLLEKVQELYK